MQMFLMSGSVLYGQLKGFPKVDDLITIVSGVVSVIAPPVRTYLDRALQYGNHRSAEEHLPHLEKNRRELAQEKMPRNEKHSGAWKSKR